MSTRISNLKHLEITLLIAGLLLVVYAASTYVSGRIYSRVAIANFRSGSTSHAKAQTSGLKSPKHVDFSLWSPKRVEKYKASLVKHFDEPIALLKVDNIRLEVPVFEGTSDRVLNRGVGRIAETAPIGQPGNVGIAGHRDGFFRGLKDVNVGDTMELETSAGMQNYVIDSIRVVERGDVSVLRNKSVPELTLVTCFPFYFVGSAPQRYIVHASLLGETKTMNESAKASSQATASRSKEMTQ